MDRKANWGYTALLIWLLAPDTALCFPKPTGSVTEPTSTASFKTQYPPDNGRLLIPETTGFYPTSLERDVRGVSPERTPYLGFDGLIDWFLSDSGFQAAEPTITGLPTAPETTISNPGPTKKPEPTKNAEPTKNTKLAPTTEKHGNPSYSSTPKGREPAPHTKGGSKATGFPRPSMEGQDVFLPVATGGIPSSIIARDDHPVPRTNIGNTTDPIETNKFYSGLFLGTQTNGTFTHPYNIAWAKGNGNAGSYGMSVSHTEKNVLAEGPPNDKIPGHPVSFYVNPVGIQSMILSAAELRDGTVLTAEDPKPFSANAVLRPHPGSHQNITFPLVQGMGFLTGIYTDLQPLVQTGVLYQKVVSAGSPKPGIFKYQAYLEDGNMWLIYAIPDDGKDPNFKLDSHTDLRGPQGWSGTIQVAKNPQGSSSEKLYDNSASVFAVHGVLSGAVSQDTGVYNLGWAKAGKYAKDTPLIMFALPHHVESFDDATKGRLTSIQLRTTTKGNATAVIGEQWTLIESELPISMDFAPWVQNGNNLSPSAKKVLLDIAPKDLGEDIDKQSDLNSMYFSGKALSKFATVIYAVSELGGNPGLAADALDKLKKSFARFINNRQQFPLVYDNVWKGVVSSASYGGDVGADFGNTLYNDHHFHYGYFIHAAAIIGTLDPEWLKTSKDWINTLVRDASNPVADDPNFPFSRAFDWFHGHSWAKGLFESFDGKDQESTSEDTMFAYALKMWGKTIGDKSMEARGNLMLGVLRRSLQNYFLLEKENINHPPEFVPNKVTGILFENKVDHTTYFGGNMEYIHGIHMLPLLPASSYVRNRKFVTEEWNALFASNASTPADKVEGGWQGVLYANLALIDPVTSWKYFARDGFDYASIDGGASRTWYLAFAAGMGGCRE